MLTSWQREVAFISDVTVDASGEAVGLVVRSSGGLAGSSSNGLWRMSCRGLSDCSLNRTAENSNDISVQGVSSGVPDTSPDDLAQGSP
jgi:hypothetical protein